MEYKNYTDLGIVSAKKPFNTHLLIETSTGNLYMVDSTDQTSLLKSTDKGDNWSQVANRSKDIRAIWYDRINGYLYCIEDDRGNDDITVWYLDIGDDSENVVGADIGDALYEATDIFIRDSNLEIAVLDTDNDRIEMYRWVDPNWNSQATLVQANDDVRFSYGIIIGTDYWFWMGRLSGADWLGRLFQFTGAGFFTSLDPISDVKYPATYNQYGMAYDGSDVIYFIWEDTDDSDDYLFSYSIIGDSVTQLGKQNVALMLDRNTASGVLEKAFHLTEYNIYQLHSQLAYQLHLIAQPNLGGVIVGITDNFLIAVNNGAWEMWEYEDVEAFVMEAPINMKKMGAWSASISLLSTYPLAKGMFITITDIFTTAGVSASQIIFEGFVTNFTDRYVQVANLISPAQRDLDMEFPEGDYAGRTDEIIVSLIGDHADYITVGILSNGIAMGTITFGGDKSLREIFDEFALTDHFIWYLTPTGSLYYNNGTVDSVENFTAASPITNVNKTFGNRAINYVDIKGGFISGAQVVGTPAQNIPDQQTNGRNPFEDTYSHLDLAAQCTTTNTNVLARLGTQPLIVPFTHNDPTVGVIQVGETITFEYNLADPNISSNQFLILDCIYDAKQGKANYRISDIVI